MKKSKEDKFYEEQDNQEKDHKIYEERQDVISDDFQGEDLAKTEDNLEASIDFYKKEADKWQDLYLRSLADMENLRRHSRREQEEFVNRSVRQLLTNILPFLDNLELALATPNDKGLREGITMVKKQLLDTLSKEGLDTVLADKGTDFDPHVHCAIDCVSDKDGKSNTIYEELQKGYLFKERVLRPSTVRLYK